MFVSENMMTSGEKRTPLQNPCDVKVTMTTAFFCVYLACLLRLSTQLAAGVQNR